MPAPPKHRDAIVRAALDLFRRQGYAATGVADIVAASGAPKGSLYHYFPGGKAAIAEAAVLKAGELAAETLRTLAADAPNASALLKAYARQLGAWMAASGFRDGSPTTTVLLESAPQDAAITAAGRASFATRQAVIADRLVADGHTAAKAARLAELAIAAFEGALVQARVAQTEAPLVLVAEELEALTKLY